MYSVSFKERMQKKKHKDGVFNVHPYYCGLTQESLKEKQISNNTGIDISLLNIEGDSNIAMMVRTCSLFSVDKIHIFGRKRYNRVKAVGSYKYINIEHEYGFKSTDDFFLDENKFYSFIIRNNLFPVFVEQHEESICLLDFDWSVFDNFDKKPCIVMGNEWEGIDRNIMDSFSNEERYIVEIPQYGVTKSFNVGHALSIILWDYIKYKYVSGYIGKPEYMENKT